MRRAGFEAVGALLRAELAREEHVLQLEDSRIRRSVVALVRSQKPRALPSSWRLAVAALSGVLLASFLLFAWLPRSNEAPLRYWIEDRAGNLEQWVTSREVARSLRFSDGSSVVVNPETTARVVDISASGARLTLERGALQAYVVPRQGARWQVSAGPFTVRVKGTRFNVAWDAATETLQVAVSEGRVSVEGGGHPSHELAAGSELELRVTNRHGSAGASSQELASEPARAPAVSSQGGAAEAHKPSGSPEPVLDWRELASAGHFREALSSVEKLGFGSQCGLLPPSDLLTLGSTARLAGQPERAREAYSALRKRFAGSPQAALAAFSLGRLAFDAQQPAEALRYFKQYQLEQPGGQLAREAAGRVMELSNATGQREAARAAARSYLARYPDGPHATLARSLLAAQ